MVPIGISSLNFPSKFLVTLTYSLSKHLAQGIRTDASPTLRGGLRFRVGKEEKEAAQE